MNNNVLMENTSHFLIALSSWMFFLYKNSAERYGWRQGTWSLNNGMFMTGLISLVILFFLLPDHMSGKNIFILYILSFFGSAIILQSSKEYSQYASMIFYVLGWIMFILK